MIEPAADAPATAPADAAHGADAGINATTKAPTASRPRKTRSDKQRNRAHILEVAEEFFTEQGAASSLDAIAKRAGIGPGTLYRHFPTREALLAALLEARDEELTARRDAIVAEETDSARALERWLDALDTWASAFNGLPDPLRDALTTETSPLAMTCQGYVTTTDQFLAAAQRDGRAQPWVRGRELFLSVLATAWVRGAALADEASAQSLRAILRSGWALPD
ncbi:MULTISPECIES: TetR/AcrR family transcriptional regulator [Kineococcus]|uniref:TetR/AcrR family transcriptional regulator n=1 Tax=unclassified Kineococcus TaxID=2621656 RepID=UPI001F577FB8|nr:TetR/AcrR family transcriptional regulator [Kineococcus sp. TRM81007]MCI2238575.1 TetR/AcrR family transcriptional regulator [Kineococcus sp. TRM81007]MCI3924568.1 TetR/AcrR family transcriptional regulator [Paenibacillus sp. TRM 82003]